MLEASATADLFCLYWKLLDEALRVLSGFEVPEELQDSIPLKAAPTDVGSKSFSSSSSSIVPLRKDDGCPQWLQALDRLLPGVLVHNAPMVRASCLVPSANAQTTITSVATLRSSIHPP